MRKFCFLILLCLSLLELTCCGNKGSAAEEAHPEETDSNYKNLNDVFSVDLDSGYCYGNKIHQSEGKTFVAISDIYAKDAHHVYICEIYRDGKSYYLRSYAHSRIFEPGEPKTFSHIGGDFYKDKRRVYYQEYRIRGANPEYFQALDGFYGKDQHHVFYLMHQLKSVDPKKFVVLKTGYYAKDNRHVLFSGKFVKGAHAPSFEILKDNYARDRKKGYYRGKALRNSNGRYLHALGNKYAIDDKVAYHEDKLINGSNAKYFRVLSESYSKDNLHVFYNGVLVPGADAVTFDVIQGYRSDHDSRDFRHKYYYGEKVSEPYPGSGE